jgi:hypothetical protein
MIRRLLLVALLLAFVPLRSARASVPAVAEVVPSSGTGASEFALRLPPNAACSGDSATKDFRVQSFMLPVGVDPASINFGSTGPLPSAVGDKFRQPLYTTTSSPFVNAQTANAERLNEPGAIVNLPAFNLAVFGRDDVPAGAYTIGVACTRGSAAATTVERVWSAPITVRVTAGGLVWTSETATVANPAAARAATAVPAPQPDAVTPSAGVVPAKAHTRAAAPNGAPPSLGLPVFDLLRDVPLASPAAIAVGLGLVAIVIRLGLVLTHNPTRPWRTHAL